jgi:hypothetical protein
MPVDPQQCSSKGPRAATWPWASMANEAPSNTTSSWPPTRCAYSSGRPVACTRCGHAGLALAALSRWKGEALMTHSTSAPAAAGGLGGFVEPGVFADQQAETAATGGEHHRALPCIAARDEIAPLVEHLVVGQFTLAVGATTWPPASTDAALNRCTTATVDAALVALAFKLVRMADHQVQAVATPPARWPAWPVPVRRPA